MLVIVMVVFVTGSGLRWRAEGEFLQSKNKKSSTFGRVVGAGGYVGEGWEACGEPCERAGGGRSLSPGRSSGLSTGRAKRANRWPLAAIVHISTGSQGSISDRAATEGREVLERL
jgi:hypothetical protein